MGYCFSDVLLRAAAVAPACLVLPATARAADGAASPVADTEQRPQALSGFVARPLGLAFAFDVGVLSVPDDLEQREGVGAPIAPSLALRFAFLRYLYVEGGAGWSSPADEKSFEQEACGNLSGTCDTYESVVTGPTAFAETGLLLRVFLPIAGETWQAAFLGGVGHRGIHLRRHISKCENCTEEELAIDGGAYLSPELDLSWVENVAPGKPAGAVGLRCQYEHYLSGDVVSSWWFGAFVEAM